MAFFASARAMTVNAIAWACAGIVMALFRCFTLLILNRFPSTVLPDVEVFTALWVLTQAPYAWRWSNTRVSAQAGYAIDVALSPQQQQLDTNSNGTSETNSLSGGGGSGEERSASEASTTASLPPFGATPVQLSKHLVLYSTVAAAEPTSPTPETSSTPRQTQNTTPQTQVPGPGPIRGPLFLSPSDIDTPSRGSVVGGGAGGGGQTAAQRAKRVLLWLNLSTAAQRRGVSLQTLMTMSRAADMSLAVLEMEPLQSAPSLDVTLDHVVEAVKLVTSHFVGPNGISSKSQLDRLFALADAPPPLVTIGGCALTATVAMLAVARRFPALMQCNGLLLFDPFVGWTCSPQSRRVSFHDESLNSATLSDSETNNGSFSGVIGGGGSSAWSNPTSPATPARVPTKGAVKQPNAQRRKSLSPPDSGNSPPESVTAAAAAMPTSTRSHGIKRRSPTAAAASLQRRSLLDIAGDTVHEVAAAVRNRLRKDFLTKALRVWFPAAQWASAGCAVPIFVVVDATSIWAEDQIEFVQRWRQSGDDIEYQCWAPDAAWELNPHIALSWEHLRTLSYARRRQQQLSPGCTFGFSAMPPLSELPPLTPPAQPCAGAPAASASAAAVPPPPTTESFRGNGPEQLRVALVEATSWLMAFRNSNNATPALSIDTPGILNKYSALHAAGLYRPVALNGGAVPYGAVDATNFATFQQALPPMLRSLKRLNSRESVQGDTGLDRHSSTGFSARGDGTSLPSAESVSDLLLNR